MMVEPLIWSGSVPAGRATLPITAPNMATMNDSA